MFSFYQQKTSNTHTESAVVNLVKLERLSVSEYSLFKGVYKWAENKKGSVDSSRSCDVKSHLANIIPFIRFPCMAVHEFLDVSKTGILSAQERYLL